MNLNRAAARKPKRKNKMAFKCYNCDAEVVYGEPHEFKINGKLTLWCAECIEEYSQAMWPEDWGPRAPQMHPPQSKRSS